MPRDTDCGCCEAQSAFVVCYECGKGEKKGVPLCKDCSSFIHRGLLSGHQVSSISRLNDREIYDRDSPAQHQTKSELQASRRNDRELYDRGSPGQPQMKSEHGFYESRSSSKGHVGSSYSDRHESSTSRSSSKYGDRDDSKYGDRNESKYGDRNESRNESRSNQQNRSNSSYSDRNESRSVSSYTDRNESRVVPQAASSSTYSRNDAYPETIDDVITYTESEVAANGFRSNMSNDFVRLSEYPDSRSQDYGNHGSNRNSDLSPEQDALNDPVVSSTYPTHQPMPSLPNHERKRPGHYPLLPKVRYMDDEIFKVEVNSSLHPDGTFWAALVKTSEEEIEFQRFEDDLRLSAVGAKTHTDKLERGAEVLANVKNTWCRAKVEYDIDSTTYKIRQTDYGSSARVHMSQLRYLPLKFYTVPYQALRCCIASKEVEKFDRDSQNLFQNMTERRSLVAQVIQCDTQNKTFYVKLLQNEENGMEQINISERVLQKAAISLGRALQIAKTPDLRVTKYFSSESTKDDVLEVKVSGDALDSSNRKRPMVMIAQRPKVLRGSSMPKTDENGQPRCFHCNHYGHFAKFCPRKTCRGWKRKK